VADAIGLSQFISNVPATILLLNYVPPSTLLAWAVNVGGFGLLPGSLANLIALRMAAIAASGGASIFTLCRCCCGRRWGYACCA
jgi:Na+/H+ antiporter NhaD/arsenite permease-like protein